MIFDELGDSCYVAVGKDAPVLEHGIAIALHEEFSRTCLGQFAVTGVDVHALNNAEGREIETATVSMSGISYTNAFNRFQKGCGINI